MADYTKRIISYIFWPFAFLGGVIWFLISKNQRLSGEIKREKAVRELDKVVSQLEAAGKEANEKEDDYQRSRAEFAAAMSEYTRSTEVRGGAKPVSADGTAVPRSITGEEEGN